MNFRLNSSIFERVINGELTIIFSDLLEAELFWAPLFVRELLLRIPAQHIEKIGLSPEAIELADKYINGKVVGKTSRADCQHIAIATLCKLTFW